MFRSAAWKTVAASFVLVCARAHAQCSTAQLTFARTDYPLASAPAEVLIGDWNLDGLLDIASIAGGDASAAVLLATSAGVFAPLFVQPIAEPAKDAQAGDVDDDGVLDLVIASKVSARVDTWKGTGSGAFTFSASYTTLALPGEIDLERMDANGTLDLVVTQPLALTLSMARGIGDGSFLPVTAVPAPNLTSRLRAVDLNADGAADVAAGAGAILDWDVHTWLGDGALGLSAKQSTYLTGAPVDFDLADWNHDGRADVATPTNDFFGLLTEVRLGTGDGKFGGYHTWANGYGRLLTSDLDLDGWLELVQWPAQGSQIRWSRGVQGGVLCFYSTGSAEAGITVAGQPAALSSADLDGDGDWDLVSANSNDTCSVLLTHVGACPAAPVALVPDTIFAVGPTLESHVVQVNGAGMDCITGVSIAGAPLPYDYGSGYATTTKTKLLINVPLLQVQGIVPVEIFAGGITHTFPLRILANNPPLLKFAEFPYVSMSQGSTLLLGATPGALAVIGLSLSTSPTIFPGVGTLSIGAGGTSLWWLHGYVLGAKGWDMKSYSFGASLPVGLPLYFQAVVFDPAAATPFKFSNELSASVSQ